MMLLGWLLASAARAAPLGPGHSPMQEALRALVERGVLQGYPDGSLKGDRCATRWEVALEVARALARLEQEHPTLAARHDLEQLQELARELRPELDALGVRVGKLEAGTEQLDHRVEELERLHFYGRLETVSVVQSFRTTGSGSGPVAGTGAAGSLRPQQAGVFPTVDYRRTLPLTNGVAFTSKAVLGLKFRLSDWDLKTEFGAFTHQGDAAVAAYWGLAAPNLLSVVTSTVDNPQQPFTSMVLDRIEATHAPTQTRIRLGAYDDLRMDPLVYWGQPNLSVFPPPRYVGYGFQLQGQTGPEKTSRLLYEVLGSRYGDGNQFAGQDYKHYVLGSDLAWEFGQGRGRLKLNWARLSDEAPTGGPLVVGLTGATNVAYASSSGWTPTQWVNPPGFFAAERPGAPLDPATRAFVPNVVDTRPIPGWNPHLDNAVGISAGGGDFGPISQNTYGLSAAYRFEMGLRLAGEYAVSEFRSNRNSPFSRHGEAYRLEVGGALEDLDLMMDWVRVDPTYNPNLEPNNALGRRAPLTLLTGGRFHLHDAGTYPHNRTGLRARLKGKFDQGSWWVGVGFLRQTRTSMYDVRSPASAGGAPNFPVIGFAPGFLDPVFSGLAHPNLYGKASFSSFTPGLEPLEDPLGREQLLAGGATWGPVTLSYENRRYSRPTSLTPARGGSQNRVEMRTQWLSLATRWDLDEDLAVEAGCDWMRSRGHWDPGGLYNAFATSLGSVSFVNLDGIQGVPNLGLRVKLDEHTRWGLSARYYSTLDRVGSGFSTAKFTHPFDWEGPQVTGEFSVDF